MYETQQPLIRFPTITKLLYTGNPYETQYQPRKTLSNNKIMNNNSYKTNIVFGGLTKLKLNLDDQYFNVVHLPQGTDVLGISSMNMIQREVRSTSQLHGPKLSKSLEKERKTAMDNKESSKKGKKVLSLIKNKSQSTNLTGINFSVGRKFTKSQTNFGHFTIEKKTDFTELYQQVIFLLRRIYGISLKKQSNRVRRAKIQSGNNGLLVKQTIKKRSWWNTTSENYHNNIISLVWTQQEIKIKSKKKGEVVLEEVEKFEERSESPEKGETFKKNFGQTLGFYPKMLQLFFTEEEKVPKKISEWIRSFPEPCKEINLETVSINNHLEGGEQITNKKMLFRNLMQFFQNRELQPFEHIPKTYHLTAFSWQSTIKFIVESEIEQKKSGIKTSNNKAWFIKPGENSNRGRGITVYKTIQEALDFIVRNPPKDQKRSYILQKYITPLLYQGRKFDIRCYMLGIRIFDQIAFYWYEEGYIRTASSKFSFQNTSKKVHLTNDAVQKNMEGYGQFQQGNKLSYSQIEKYLRNAQDLQFSGKILPQMKKIATYIADASAHKLGSKNNISFELFGLDFILEQKGKPYLLQVNTNPSLEICCNLTSRIISQVIQNTFRLVLDMIFPSPKNTPEWAQNFILQNKFMLIHRSKGTTQ